MRSAPLLAVLLLGGCALLEPRVEEIVSVDRVLGESMALSRAGAGEQKAALAAAEEAYRLRGDRLSRLRFAALLATLPPPLRDESRAYELLEPLADVRAPGAGRSAALLSMQIAERQRLAREAERLGREAERVSRELDRAARERQIAEKERQSLEKERQTVEKERDKREEALRQQLEALRAIERGILEREERMRKKPPGRS